MAPRLYNRPASSAIAGKRRFRESQININFSPTAGRGGGRRGWERMEGGGVFGFYPAGATRDRWPGGAKICGSESQTEASPSGQQGIAIRRGSKGGKANLLLFSLPQLT